MHQEEIVDAPEADLGVHPTGDSEAPSGTADIAFYCDDVEQTVLELTARGVEFVHDVEDHGYGLVTHMKGARRLHHPAVPAEVFEVR